MFVVVILTTVAVLVASKEKKKMNYYLAECTFVVKDNGDETSTVGPMLVKAESQLEAEEKVKNHFNKQSHVDKVIEVWFYITIE